MAAVTALTVDAASITLYCVRPQWFGDARVAFRNPERRPEARPLFVAVACLAGLRGLFHAWLAASRRGADVRRATLEKCYAAHALACLVIAVLAALAKTLLTRSVEDREKHTLRLYVAARVAALGEAPATQASLDSSTAVADASERAHANLRALLVEEHRHVPDVSLAFGDGAAYVAEAAARGVPAGRIVFTLSLIHISEPTRPY